ncbi:MAG: hypothetical protein ACFFDP_09000 [Promethearchaeota archaeon]
MRFTRKSIAAISIAVCLVIVLGASAYFFSSQLMLREGIFLSFSDWTGETSEPSFVFVTVDGENRRGGLWGIVDGVRTIDCGYRNNDPRILDWWEAQLNETHWRAITYLDVGTRTANFYVEDRTLLLVTEYNLTGTVDIVDWYWEQCNGSGVDYSAEIVVGFTNGSSQHLSWQVTDVPDVLWVWLEYIEWMTGKLRTVLFNASVPATALFRENHGNDIAFMRSGDVCQFKVRIEFDVSAP